MSRKPEYRLNPEQSAVAAWTGGPVVVSSGAGTGKTTAIAGTVASLVRRGIAASAILLLTFTRRAAREMIRRAEAMLDSRCRRVQGGTFHSWANGILRRYGRTIGVPTNFTILDPADAADVVQLLRVDRGLAEGPRRFPNKSTLTAIFSAHRSRCVPIRKILEDDAPQFLPDEGDIEALFAHYQKYKTDHGQLDFDDLLERALELLETCPSISANLARQHKYVLVDEFQDTDRLQARLLHGLASQHSNVLVVGDELQSIFRFRGADITNLTGFRSWFAAAKVLTLTRNHRSTQQILNVANELIAQSNTPYKKRLVATKPEGPRPQLVVLDDEPAQAEWVAQQILALREEGLGLNEIAVLFRSSYVSADLERELLARNIPFEKYGGLKFFESAHVRDVLAHLRVIANPRDAAAWMRILQLVEGIGPRRALAMTNAMVAQASHVGLAAKMPRSRDLRRLDQFLTSLAEHPGPPTGLLDLAITYYDPILQAKFDNAHVRRQDLDHLAAMAARYQTLNTLLSDLALEAPDRSGSRADQTDDEDEVLTLSTIHSSKGLEWQAVFILNVSDGAIPSSRAGPDPEAIEEERRLMYVACTRAKRRLYLTFPLFTFARGESYYGKVSRFIEPIPESVLVRVGSQTNSETEQDALHVG